MILYKIQKRVEIPVTGNPENTVDMASLIMRKTLRDSVDLRRGDLLKIDIRILVEHDNDQPIQEIIQNRGGKETLVTGSR